MDCEGEPVQELSAIAMNNESYQIVSVYHKHADCDSECDEWSRRNIHGLNLKYLRENGFSNESELLANFRQWLSRFQILCMYANNPAKERKLFPKLIIHDLLLPPWEERMKMPSHIIANRFKQLNVPILNVSCNGYVHNQYVRPLYLCWETMKPKTIHGVHCSLYDCLELYFYFLMQTQNL